MVPVEAVHPDILKVPAADYPRPLVAYVADLKRGGGLPPHSHRRAQLLAVTSGSIAVMAQESTFVAPPERAVWVPAGTVHETRHLASTRLRTLYVEQDAAPNLPRNTTVVQVSPLMRELMMAIIQRPRLYDDHGSDGRLVAVLLDQIAASVALPLSVPMPRSEPLKSIAIRLLDSPAEQRSIGDLANSLDISVRTLERRFKAETGTSFRNFRRQAKLFKALEMLAVGTPVSRVSDELGFEEPSAFIAMFKAAFGKTPGRYFNPN